MKKLRKVLSVLLTLAMALGMSMTTFAAEPTITVNNAGDGKFNCVKIVTTSNTTETGWDIVDTYADAFKSAFGLDDEQKIIKGMINNVDSTKGAAIEGFAGKYAIALNSIFNRVSDGTLTSPIEVTEGAGVYFVKGSETGYTYSPMAAYIGFGEYTGSTPGALKSATIEAKKQPTTVEKTSDAAKKVTEIGRTETYHINGYVPYVPTTDSNRNYYVTDTITGAEYVLTDDEMVTLTVIIGTGETAVTRTFYGTISDEGNSFTADLSSLLENNTYANKAISISYQAVVTDVQVGNTVNVGNGTNNGKYGSSSENLYTGQITLTKTGENNTVLANAGFEVRKGVEVEDEDGKKMTYPNDALRFELVEEVNDDNETVKVYEYNPTGSITKVVTGEDGTVTVRGLDVGTYQFKEVKAPEGYSINTTPAEATLSVSEDKATGIFSTTTSMTDTKLSALPSTGGIGTTIFTIVGCLLMIGAASILFISRRRASK